jgi:hypothetical protein
VVGANYKSIKVEPRTNPLLSSLGTQGECEVNQVQKGLRTVVVGASYKSIKVERRTNPLLSSLVAQEKREVNQLHKGLRTVGVSFKSIKVEPRTNPLLSLLVTQEESEVNQLHKGLRTVGNSFKSIKVEPRTNPLLSLLVTQEVDYILGDTHVCDSAVKGGSLGMHEGLHSNHTMQFVDFDQQRLFGNESFTPIVGQELQFTLKNAIKKRAFLTKLREIHQHQKIVERVQALELAFRNEGKTTALEQCYNRVVYEIRCSMLAAANAQARKSFRYQWSPALVTAGRMKRFWRTVIEQETSYEGYTDGSTTSGNFTNT